MKGCWENNDMVYFIIAEGIISALLWSSVGRYFYKKKNHIKKVFQRFLASIVLWIGLQWDDDFRKICQKVMNNMGANVKMNIRQSMIPVLDFISELISDFCSQVGVNWFNDTFNNDVTVQFVFGKVYLHTPEMMKKGIYHQVCFLCEIPCIFCTFVFVNLV